MQDLTLIDIMEYIDYYNKIKGKQIHLCFCEDFEHKYQEAKMDEETTCLHDGETYDCVGFNAAGEQCKHCSICFNPVN